eukprot:Skav210897  [mRNA]  locus=scaffold2900:2025:3689:+ [translate_table: standard]
MGDELAHRTGVKDWVKTGTWNSERDAHRTVQKHGSSLDIPISEMDVGGDRPRLPWINPKDWFQYIIRHGLLYMLSGLQFQERDCVGQVWKRFWARYRVLNEDFSLFRTDFNPETTIGLFLHGDEGRTLKKSGIMVTSLQSILGYGFDRKRLKVPLDERKLQVNFSGHTFLTRLVVSVCPKILYQSDPDLFHNAMNKLAEQMKLLLDVGIRDPITGISWKFVILGIKGDMPYLQKIGRLKRSWNTGVKRGNQRRDPPGVCHLCLAGCNRYPCEDTGHVPGWLPTIGVRLPWDVTPSMLRVLPHDESNPATYFQADLWHCIHLGIGKSFVASTLQLALAVVPASNNEDRFEWLTSHYMTWCRTTKKSSHISKITGYLVSYNEPAGATGNWSKGSLTSNFMRWIVFLLRQLDDDDAGYLARCRQAAEDINAVLGLLYNSSLFLDQNQCRFVYEKGMSFLQAYTDLARDLFQQGRWQMFPLFPKVHAIQHIWLTVKQSCDNHTYAVNPIAMSCQQDEDIVGKISRGSRRVSSRAVIYRTLQRHLMGCYKVWKEAKILV